MPRLNSTAGLAPRIAALEAATPTARTLTTGVTSTNDPSGALPTSGGHSFVVALPAQTFRFRILKIRMRLRGDGPGGAGNQKGRGVAYAGTGNPGLASAALVAQGTERTVTNPTTSQLWEFTMPSTAIVAAGVAFSAGVFFDNTSSVNQAMTIPYVAAAADTLLQNNDTYSDGAVSPFGTLTAGYSRLPLVEVDIEPAPADYATDITALQAADTTITADIGELQSDVADLQAGGTSGGGSVVVLESGAIMGAGDIHIGEPVDCTGGKQVEWRAFTDVAPVDPGMQIDESISGSWVAIRRPDGYSALESNGAGRFTGGLAAPSARSIRSQYFNGPAAQGVFELWRSVT